jgi:hypothetical protein
VPRRPSQECSAWYQSLLGLPHLDAGNATGLRGCCHDEPGLGTSAKRHPARAASLLTTDRGKPVDNLSRRSGWTGKC